jgi:predicted RNA-binding Zn-ribbon protein involved in translation (DUF1610 family)
MKDWISCVECDEIIDGELVNGEFEDSYDFPDECPNCGHSTIDDFDCDVREDFARGT